MDNEGNGNGEGGDDDHVPAEKDRVGLNDVGVFDSDLYSGSGQCRWSLETGLLIKVQPVTLCRRPLKTVLLIKLQRDTFLTCFLLRAIFLSC